MRQEFWEELPISISGIVVVVFFSWLIVPWYFVKSLKEIYVRGKCVRVQTRVCTVRQSEFREDWQAWIKDEEGRVWYVCQWSYFFTRVRLPQPGARLVLFILPEMRPKQAEQGVNVAIRTCWKGNRFGL